MAWIPANPVHAIDRATIKFEFGPLPTKPKEKVFGLIRDCAAKFGLTDFSTFSSPGNPIKIPIDPKSGEIHLPSNLKPPLLRAFVKKGENNNPIEEVILGDDYFAVNIFAYDKWAAVSSRVSGYFESAVEYLTNEIEGIAAVRYEYWDRFSRQSGSKDSLINPNSKLIGPAFHEIEGSWHTHLGLFKSNNNFNLLLNANVDIISMADALKGLFELPAMQDDTDMLCRIYTLAVMKHIENPTFSDFGECMKAMNVGHDELKSLIGEIVVPELAASINLEAKEFSL